MFRAKFRYKLEEIVITCEHEKSQTQTFAQVRGADNEQKRECKTKSPNWTGIN